MSESHQSRGETQIRQVDCDGLQVRNSSGEVLCESIVDLLISDERTENGIRVHDVVISLPQVDIVSTFGDVVLHLWDTHTDLLVCTCSIRRRHSDFQREACKVEGWHVVGVVA